MRTQSILAALAIGLFLLPGCGQEQQVAEQSAVKQEPDATTRTPETEPVPNVVEIRPRLHFLAASTTYPRDHTAISL